MPAPSVTALEASPTPAPSPTPPAETPFDTPSPDDPLPQTDLPPPPANGTSDSNSTGIWDPLVDAFEGLGPLNETSGQLPQPACKLVR